jgi:CheY-like chemotaxis protein
VRRAEKLESLGLMAGSVAHDFNNLLTAIGGHARLALDALPPTAAARRHLTEVLEASDLAADLTRQLLAYTGRGRVADEFVDVSQLVEEMVRLLAGSFAERVDVHADLAPDLPAVCGDPTQLRRLVMNLATNAADALGEEPGFVTFRTASALLTAEGLRGRGLAGRLESGEHVVLEVCDSGCGMDAQTQASIFDPFYTTKERGRGLGLAAVSGIARAHRGAVEVESEPGRGTTFRVWLPGSGRSARPARRGEVAVGRADGWRGSGLLLLVDDEARVRRLARQVLERAGFGVLEADGGDQALELFAEHADRIRLVLLDLTMPGLAGEAVLREIHAREPAARVLLSSGYDEGDAMRRLASQKLGGFLPKPYQPADLLDAVRRVLEGDPADGPRLEPT